MILDNECAGRAAALSYLQEFILCEPQGALWEFSRHESAVVKHKEYMKQSLDILEEKSLDGNLTRKLNLKEELATLATGDKVRCSLKANFLTNTDCFTVVALKTQ